MTVYLLFEITGSLFAVTLIYVLTIRSKSFSGSRNI